MKVLIADKFPEEYIQKLKDAELDVIYNPKLGENDLPDLLDGFECLIVRSTNVTADAIEKSQNLNLIVRAGSGVNNINLEAANKKGVYVSNCPGKNSIAVAELAVGLMLSLDRRIAHNVIDFRTGKWNKGEYSKSQGLFGKVLAIIGYGAIGKEVAKRAQALGMNIYAKDIFKVEGFGAIEFFDYEKVLPMADVVTVHLPQTSETKNLFNDKMFALMKEGSIFINTSRAGVVDEDALVRAINEKGIKAGLDVFKNEPEGKKCDIASPLQNVDNLYLTHHIGASTEQAQNAVAEETVNIILNYLRNGTILNWVNKAKTTSAHYQFVVKHYDKPGVLASVLNVLKEGFINVEEVENLIFEGGLVACCTMKLSKPPTKEMVETFKNNQNVLTYTLKTL